MNILLDTNVIVSDPGVLALSVPDTNLIVLESTLVELQALQDRAGRRLLDLVRRAKDEGTVYVIGVSTLGETSGIPEATRLTHADVQLLSYASNLSRSGDVLIATNDRDIHNAADRLGVETVTAQELHTRILAVASKNVGLSNDITLHTKHLRIYIASSFVAGILATILLRILFLNIQVVLSTINVWGTIFALLALPVGLFMARERWLLPYSVVEFGAGFATALLALPGRMDYSQFQLQAIVPILGGVYIMVRGLSNFDRAVQAFPLSELWNKLAGRS